jgi:SAM-dependent methyltransferase
MLWPKLSPCSGARGIVMEFRSAFDAVAELYDAIRPRYPAALFAELVSRTGLHPQAELLEIAPGTGQATLPLARRGYRITAVELGAGMTRVARDRLAAYPHVTILNAAFEDVALTSTFDLVYVATAWHWIAPEIRFVKSHALLKPGGHLAIIQRHHVSDGSGDAFPTAIAAVYRRYRTSIAPGARTYFPRQLEELRPEPIDSARFTPAAFSAFPEAVRYSAAGYVDLLHTYSPILAMPPSSRRSFLGEVGELIASRFGDHVLQHYAMTLQLLRALPG